MNELLEKNYKSKLLKLKVLWQDIKEAIKGSKQDFTEGKLSRAMLLLAIPMVLEMVMESIFAVVDIYFVSKIGADAVATVGITEAMVTVIYALGLGFAVATTAVVSRRIGEKEPKKATNVAIQAIFITILVSAVIGLIGIFFNKQLLQLMGASESMIISSRSYTGIILGSNMVIMLLFVINAIFRSSGDAAISMKVLWLANIINIILDPCLIFGLGPFPQLGIKGAAIATTIGRGTAVIYQFYLLFKGKGRIHIIPEAIKLDFTVIRKIVTLSRGSIGQYLITTTSWIGLVRIIAVFGSEVLAGYTLAIRIVIFSLLPSWGLSNAAATLVGQNLGAKKIARAEKSVWISGITNMIMLVVVGIVFIWQAGFFIRLFTSDANVVRYGTECLRIISYGFAAYALGMVITQAFNGAGDTNTPMKINFFCFWLFEIPLAWLLALAFGMGQKGAYIAVVSADTLLVIISVILFRKGKWKNKKI